MDERTALLKLEYGIQADSVLPTSGGFSAKAYRVGNGDGPEYFLKVYDKALPTTRAFVERIDSYMPVLDWLSATPRLRGRVLTPVRTRSGGYKAETAGHVLALFLFVQGKTPGIYGMTLGQTEELAEILARLHEAGGSIPFETPALCEDTTLPFCGKLMKFLDTMDAHSGVLYEFIAPHAELLLMAALEALRLRDALRLGYAHLVLCHGDAHGGNVIQGQRLVLADWEDLRFAPAEADLFIHAWHPHGRALLEAYANMRSGFTLNREMLYFYTLRRRVEDIWVDIQRLTEEAPGEAETAELQGYIRQGIDAVRALKRL